MSSKPKICDLKIDRDLLDTKFEGYKLCLDQLPIDYRQLPSGLKTILPSSDQWSYEHLRLFSNHNHLHIDPWTIDEQFRRLYLVLSDGIYALSIEKQKYSLPEFKKIHEFPNKDIPNGQDKFNPSLSFSSSNRAVFTDGCGNLIVFSTEIDSNQEKWQILHQEEKLCENRAFVIFDSRYRTIDGTDFLDILVKYVIERGEKSDGEKGGLFSNLIEWISFKKTSDEAMSIFRRRRLQANGNLDYIALNKDCNVICCLTSDTAIRFIYDSEKPVEIVEKPAKTQEAPIKEYSWGQTADEICVIFTFEPQITKNDIVWRLTSENIHVAIEQQSGDQKLLLEGEFHLPVDVDGSAWTMENGRMEITLQKRDVGRMWTDVINGDNRGEYVADPDLVKEVSERLKKFTSDSENPAQGPISNVPFNADQLEECDAVDTEATALLWMDGGTHKTTVEADTGGHQWLFNVRLHPNKTPYICLRHDVDGILWQVNDPNSMDIDREYFKHHFTFNAFGYVQAGKPDRKFCTCAPDGSYAVVADCNRHAYIYWQPTMVDSDLRNRKTGQKVPKVSKQQLISVTGDSGGGSMDIFGVVALDDVLLLLMENRLMAVYVK